MNGTRSNSLAKVNYSGVELTPLPNILLRTKKSRSFFFFFFFSPCPHLASVCTGAAKFAAEDQCLVCQGNFRQTNSQSAFQAPLFEQNAISLTADHSYGPLVPN